MIGRANTTQSHRPRHAQGVTLTEVLMALMVMGIGLVSVVTLFPLSLLRSVEATKLTNATMLRQNAEARIKASIWQDAATGDYIDSAILFDPDRDGDVGEHVDEKYLFDPLGANVLVQDSATVTQAVLNANNATPFGSTDADDNIIAPGETQILRYTFGMNSVAAAEDFVTLPDSFINLIDATAGTGTNTFTPLVTPLNTNTTTIITFSGTPFAEYVTTPPTEGYMVTLYDVGENKSSIVEGTISNANTLLLGTPTAPKPISDATQNLTTVDRIIIDQPERRYTWLATIRNVGENPSVSVAVFFRRSFSPLEEKVYLPTKPLGTFNTYLISGLDPSALPPGFEVGGWMFDLDNFRWWKIARLQDLGSGSYRILTDPEEFDGPKSGDGGAVRVIFPDNIVEVYSLKKD